MSTQTATNGDVLTPTLPKGGGAIHSIGTGWGAVGMTGGASFQIPLPFSPGRGFTAPMSLSYHSELGNSPFGMGWNASAAAISRSTLKGVPAYNPEDVFIGPSGSELIPERAQNNTLLTRVASHYNGLQLDSSYTVVRYLPRNENTFDRIEHWSSQADTAGFWLVQGADGNIHLYGKTHAARIADSQMPTHVAQWLLEESLNPHGEQIYYQYKADTQGIAQRDFSAQRYLARICYGNITAKAQLMLWTTQTPAPRQWHFELLFDYGERTRSMTQAPSYLEQTPWLERTDPYFSYAYGFELGSRRLCQQVLMFHYFPEEAELGSEPVLTRRLLFEYTSTHTQVNQLCCVHHQACEASGAISHWPPLELTYSDFSLTADPANWRSFDALQGPINSQGYQLVDLYRDGLPGVLYRSDKSWYYREPLRADPAQDANHVVYGALQTLERIPVADQTRPLQQSLADLDGDGQLDWIIAQPGMSGFFTLNSNRQWSNFAPFTALPQEFFHPQGQLADLMGNGVYDLALIGSNSVRLYINQGQLGFSTGTDVAHQPDDDHLPLPSDGTTELLAFSDVLGSGQQHLIRIRHNEIKCWPNLGRGRLGKGFIFATLPFTYAEFEASRVLLGDLDGSGASDLLYVQPDQVLIFMNHSGNGLQSTPASLPWPEGVKHDRFSHASVSDLQGLGCSSLILTVNHPTPRHWRYDFVSRKPYLLISTDNNMGAVGHLDYSSSAQQWLDEKQQRLRDGKPPISGLPFALHLVTRQQQHDEISGNQLTQCFTYREGYYDGLERKFQGYGLLLTTDTEQSIQTASHDGHTAALLRKTWSHTGQSLDMPREDYWSGDERAHPLGNTLLTRLERDNLHDTLLPTPSPGDLREASLALSGLTLREEVFAAADSGPAAVPYTVSEHRYHLRQLHPSASQLVLPLESKSYRYERERTDPACQHTINLRRDRFGALLHGLTIDYARRTSPGDLPPFNEPHQQTWWRDTHDPAQQAYYISEVLAQPIHLDGNQRWRLHLPYRQRSNALVLEKDSLDSAHISYEHLISSGPANPLGLHVPRSLASMTVQHYTRALSDSALPQGHASFEALPAYLESAELDATALSAYDDLPALPGAPSFDLADTLRQEHYHPLSVFLSNDNADDTQNGASTPLWSLRLGFAQYSSEQNFYRATRLRPSESHSFTDLAYDRYHCHIASVTSIDGCQTQAVHDYRLLLPIKIIDPQGSVQQARYDAFGQLQATSIYGHERGEPTGFAPLEQYMRPADDSPQTAIQAPEAALLDAASACFYAPFNWMGQIPVSPERAQWIAKGYLTPGGYIRASGRARVSTLDVSQPENRLFSEQIRLARREPVYGAVLQADTYTTSDPDMTRHIHINLTCSDGFGRVLQTKQKTSAGMAYVVDPSGGLSQDSQAKPLRQHSEKRWRVSGRVEYNNKGLPIRSYRPYFADQYGYIEDDSLRKISSSDQSFYDPLGRLTSTINAKGALSRQTYHTWYTVSEDENDTLED